MKRNYYFLIGLILMLLVSACGNNGVKQQETSGKVTKATSTTASQSSIKIAYPTQATDMLPLWVALDKGIFTKYGLSVEPVYIGGSTKVMQALLSGSVNYGFTSPAALGSAYLNNQKTITLANLTSHSATWIYGQKEIKDMAGLKGKSLITAAVGTLYESMANYALQEGNLKVESDVKLVNIAGSGDRQAAFLRGASQGIVAGMPLNYQLDKQGYPVLFDFSKIEMAIMPLTTLPEYYSSHKEESVSLVKALAEANSFIKSHKDEVANSIVKWTNSSKEDAEKTYETLTKIDAFPVVPKISKDSFMFPIQYGTNEQLKGLTDPEKTLYTNEIIDQLEKEGFFNSLAK